MTLSSSAFDDGGLFPSEYTCDGTETKSPPLAWTPGVEGTLSYAIIFNDNTPASGSQAAFKFAHSAIYDIPQAVLELPEGVEAKYKPATPAGAKQAPNYKGNPGFIGPCPPTGEHTYEFTLYALKVETLPGLTQTSKVADVQAAAEKEKLGSVKLTAKYTQQ
jgi:Raf kinase inhibitor-like YbhB/YbcL family protein